ncbi:S41 family peptidase [Avrilella dinanensis]|uniref:Tail specific protease domain-containing protein n=1 Tax=Avrilella dinanensis TaxID=2008672 RepID=A0A2M9R5T0_9FLAO|nr:S41 family peptidase [Avrilella dinanensis]PJR04201.1 hypothetical protein CDL10_06420 [Avrilella dinanensis]
MKNLLTIISLLFLFSCKQNENATNKISSFQNLELKQLSFSELQADFDLLVNSLKEAHTGLYWYSTEKQFDSLVSIQRTLLKDNLNSLQFYNIVSPIIAFSKEDHCDISLSDELNNALAEKGFFLPLIITNLNEKPLILNQPYKGLTLTEINGVKIEEIYQRIFNTFASDGFILSSKYRYLDLRGFSREYAKVIDQQKENTITTKDLSTGKTETHQLKSVSYKRLSELTAQVFNENKIREEIDKPGELLFIENNTAVLTFTTFGNSDFEEYNMNFEQFVDSSFIEISKQKSTNLIIDLRDNGGGSEGNEDYLFSYLTDKPYNKYKHVELSRFSFSFLNHTDYSSPEDRKELENELRAENENSDDGKIYRKPGIYLQEPLKNNPFKGQVYVLTSGWTYSGGAEFSTLMKEYTDAIFIGEETGGGYYGNTSGSSLELTLPNTKLVVDIPILKFVLDVKKGKFGNGIIPDFQIQPTFDEYIKGYDTELEYAKKLIEK